MISLRTLDDAPLLAEHIILPQRTHLTKLQYVAMMYALTRLHQQKKVWTLTDGFCGSGGSSLGGRMAGVWVRFAMNHAPLSLATHAHNFPECEHWQINISEINPYDTPDTDLLWMSPECTNHSKSKGVSFEDADTQPLWTDLEDTDLIYRSRMTMYDVHRFAQVKMLKGVPYKLIFVENVVEARTKWKPYELWLGDIESLGYKHKTLYINAQFMGVPQSRDRWYTVFWLEDLPEPDLEFTPPAFCSYCEQEIAAVQRWKNPNKPYGKYGTQYIYQCPRCYLEVVPFYSAALNCINWSIEAPRIKDRSQYPRLRTLKEKTTQRISAGLEKFSNEEELLPFVIDVCRTYSDGDYAHLVTKALPTQTTAQSMGLVVPPYLVDWQRAQAGLAGRPLPFVVSYYNNGKPYSSLDALGTLTSKHRFGLVQPPPWSHGIPPLEECGFRMLGVGEIQQAMGYLPDYEVLYEQEWQAVRQLGLAVCPPVAKWLIERGTAILS